MARFRSGTGEARIRGVELLDKRLRAVRAVTSGSTVTVRVYLEAVKDGELVIGLRDEVRPKQAARQKDQFYGPNLGYVLELYESYKENPKSVDRQTRQFFRSWRPPQLGTNGQASAAAGELFSASAALGESPLEDERVVVDFTFQVPLRKGRYSISAGVRASGEEAYQDKIDVVTTFRITPPHDEEPSQGIVQLPTEVKVHTPEGDRRSRSV